MKVKHLKAILANANEEMDVWIQDISNIEYDIHDITAMQLQPGGTPHLRIWVLYGSGRKQVGEGTNTFWQVGQSLPTPAPLPEPPLPPPAKLMTKIPDDTARDHDPFA